jgi:hypothetical protein
MGNGDWDAEAIKELEENLDALARYTSALARDCWDVSTFLHTHGYTDPWAKSRVLYDNLPEDIRRLLEEYK